MNVLKAMKRSPLGLDLCYARVSKNMSSKVTFLIIEIMGPGDRL